jgi:carboxymethylenebutenolidase
MSTYRDVTCEDIVVSDGSATTMTAFVAKPSGQGHFPSIVLTHRLPGWIEFHSILRLAHHGFIAICPDLHDPVPGDPNGSLGPAAAKRRAKMNAADVGMMDETDAALKWVRAQPYHNGRVGLFGSCSGARYAFTYACSRNHIDACVELWGGPVVVGDEEFESETPFSPIEVTEGLRCPLLGLFGSGNRAPNAQLVTRRESELKKYDKNYEFHRYANAGHGFFDWEESCYGPEQSVDGWARIFGFFYQHLAM